MAKDQGVAHGGSSSLRILPPATVDLTSHSREGLPREGTCLRHAGENRNAGKGTTVPEGQLATPCDS
ncbi:hypothetical protein CSB93_0214 [Pseudomonas paraeruginosa]|uniref:Uncharacterized protein n=1 Tax=Pseudomonas paraeruginosa TaxID=2994495 RepID=A0A2R3INJ9_9PSED|nr:hypothetical protein CSB93_0214 [Pseudomonas paraeruginosa]AWE92961.1 hypothetical protein CSC28_5529 [Pseudomonas paraeruginosa]PTC33851.1 hypothetical protein CLJ1_5058 [Pseudomonas aeruginosa]